MTNEEIAKDITVALVSRMVEPTTETVSNAYQTILQKVGESQQAITLQTIEAHLKKQDKHTLNAEFQAVLAVIISIVVAALAVQFGDRSYLGYVLVGYAVVMLLSSIWLYRREIKKL